MLKILLINPYCTSNKNERKYPLEPLGLLSLSTYIKKEIEKNSLDIEIKILDIQMEGVESCIKTKSGYRSGLSDDEIKDFIKKYKPDLVGITNNYTNNTQDVLELSKLIKESCSKCILVLGGAHATIDHKNIIKTKEIDAVVRGEGEETFKKIVLSLYNKSGFREILGLTYKEKNKIEVNEDGPLIEDINVLPIPDRSLIPYEKYLEKTSKIYFFPKNKPIGTLFSARGCPFRCIFCSTQKVWRNKWRSRSPENILKEIEYLMKNYGVREISFQDDQFIGDKHRIIKFCKLLIKKKLKISFIVPSGITPSLIDEKTIELMRKAGFYRICFSIDVGTEAARNFARKPVKIKKMRELIKKTNSKGLWTYATFIIGFPFEKVENVQKTIKYAYSLKLDFVRFYIAQPHLGSDLYDLYSKEGLINKNIVENYHTLFESIIENKYISSNKLIELRDSAELEYQKFHLRHFLNPIYVIQEFIPKISSIKKLAYFVGLISHYKGSI